jgi:dipeptidyl aminopeptidase/acylaminoacyl peptidase
MNYFITGQLKMIQPPSEIPEIYARNSPIAHVKNVTTPLLSYAGKEDNHVDWHQTVEFYMALRRLGKKNIMLLYPNEGHTITNSVNQRDLTQKISQWFAYHLKGELPQPWIKYE